jgi:hypothetical protein
MGLAQQPCPRQHPFLGRILTSIHCNFLRHLTMTYVVQRTTSVRAEDRRKLEVVYIPMAQPAQHI